MSNQEKTPIQFEKALQQLESIVEKMEKGDLSLEKSLQEFERGIKLTHSCQKALKEAEQRVQILVQENGENVITPFNQEDQS